MYYLDNKIDKIKKKLKWQDYFLLSVLLIFIILNYFLISQFKQLPSPIYGGDYYYHLGMMHHLKEGGSIFENSQLFGEAPWAPFLYQYIIVVISNIFGTSLITTVIYSTIFFMLISIMIIYFFSNYIFRNKTMSLIPAIIFLSYFPIFKYSNFTEVLIMPLFFFTVLVALKKNKMIYYLFAGISYGLVGISHTMAFFMASIFLLLIIIYIIFFSPERCLRVSKFILFFNPASLKNNINKRKYFFLLLIIGILIAQLYWFIPIFKFHLTTLNTISNYDQVDFSKINIISYTLNSLKEIFFDSSNFVTEFISIISIFGIFFLILKKRDLKYDFILIMLLALLISRFHYLITLPVLGREFFSRLLVSYIFITLKPILFLLGVLFLYEFMKNRVDINKFLFMFVATVLFVSIFSFNYKVQNDKWINTGMVPLPSYLTEVSSWVINNTNINDVFVSTNEISFMLNALTGRKVMNSRRAHSGMFVDVDRRWADSAVLLYGNNSQIISNIIDKYKIKYLYWQYNWLSLDYNFNDKGKLVNIFDPLLILDINNYSAYLTSNGVKYIKTNFWLDPANRNLDIKKFDTLLVIPYQWNETPFSPEFKNHIKLIKEFKENGQTIAKIYKVNS